MDSCPDDNTLAELIAGSLGEATRAMVATHAASCESCHAVVVALSTRDAEASRPPEAMKTGMRLGRYELEEIVGAGGMGVVYAAFDSELQRRVAVKLLGPRHDGADRRERLLREARTLAQLSHPNVISVFDIGERDGQVFVVMELVDGGSVSRWLRSKPRTHAEILDCMIDAGRGLVAAHAAGVVHRDIKPDNILVGLDGRVRVTDFGLARLGASSVDVSAIDPNNALTRTGTILGTPAYMAPETASGETTKLSDQWSFCATLYELVAGVRPFSIADLDQRKKAIADGQLASSARVPAWLRTVLARGLHHDPSRRWPGMEELVRALLGGRGRRRRLGIAGGVLAGVGVASVTIAMAMRSAPPDPRPLVSGLDQREGCNCPLSSCVDGCNAVCRATGYRLGGKVPGLDQAGRQEALHGVTLDGTQILYLAGERCALDRLFLARQQGDTFVSVDLTDQLAGHDVTLFEGCCTLASDGASVVFTSKDKKRLVEARLVGDRLEPPRVVLDQPMPVTSAADEVFAPVLDAEGRNLYFRVIASKKVAGAQARDGLYVAERAGRDGPFGEPRRLANIPFRYGAVSAISSDGLTLFAEFDSWETRVLVRANRNEPFAEMEYTAGGGRLWGWRAKPIGDCSRILVTQTPGGCEQEYIAYLEAE